MASGRIGGQWGVIGFGSVRQLLIVRSPLECVDENVIRDVVADCWGLRISQFRYFPKGGGAYHWIGHTDDARRWFVTCDDLDTKSWLGSDRESVFDHLTAAYGAAMDLRNAGLAFVVAPMATSSGAPAERVDERHSVSVFEHVDGEPGVWGQPVTPRVRGDLVAMLARLHASTPAVRGLGRRGLEVPGRDDLEKALADLDSPWDGGPLSEFVRLQLAGHEEVVVRSLADLDRIAMGLEADADAVVTHGEPHPGNLIRSGTDLVLVDWDTVALSRPERDLWMIVDADGNFAAAYRDLTGLEIDQDAMAAYRLLWALTDVAAFTMQLRRGHRRDADTDKALAALRSIFNGQEPSPYATSS
jgi:spectinomycin phosphotransferase